MLEYCSRLIIEYNDRLNRKDTSRWTVRQVVEFLRTADEELCRVFFSAPLPESKFKSPLTEFGRDIAKMILCQAGINTVDLYELKKEDYYDGRICYKRAKTRNSRRDEAYIEMRVGPILLPLFEKYKADASDPYLFNFHKRLTSSDSFNANVNIGLHKVARAWECKKNNGSVPIPSAIPGEQWRRTTVAPALQKWHLL